MWWASGRDKQTKTLFSLLINNMQGVSHIQVIVSKGDITTTWFDVALLVSCMHSGGERIHKSLA